MLHALSGLQMMPQTLSVELCALHYYAYPNRGNVTQQ